MKTGFGTKTEALWREKNVTTAAVQSLIAMTLAGSMRRQVGV